MANPPDDRREKILRNGAKVWIVIPSEFQTLEKSGVLYGHSPDEFLVTTEELLTKLFPAPPAQATAKTTVTQGPLNVRAGPGLAAEKITINGKLWQLPTGTPVVLELPGVTVADDSVSYHWHKISGVNGWVAGEFTGLYAAPAPPPPPPSPDPKPPPATVAKGAARFGMNFVGPGSPVSLFRLQAALQSAGNRLGPTVIINEHKALDGLNADLTIYRVKTGAGRAEPDPFDYKGRNWTPVEWFNEWWPLLSQGARPGVFVKFHNELFWQGQWARRIAWERAFIALCNERRVKIVYGNFSVEHLESAAYEALKPMFKEGAAGGHVAGFNTYWDTNRADKPAEAGIGYMLPLMDQLPGVPYVSTEYGFLPNDAAYQPGRFGQLLAIHKRLFAGRGDYRGAALWCDASDISDWRHSRIPESDFGAIVQAQGPQ